MAWWRGLLLLAGLDFEFASGFARFGRGQVSSKVQLRVLDDAQYEPRDEDFELRLDGGCDGATVIVTDRI